MSSDSGSEKPPKKLRPADSTPTSPRNTQHSLGPRPDASSSLPANSSHSEDDDDVADEAANYPDYEDDDGIADEEALKDIKINLKDDQQLFEAVKARATMFNDMVSHTDAARILLQRNPDPRSPLESKRRAELVAKLDKEGIELTNDFKWPFSTAGFNTFFPSDATIKLRSSLEETRNMPPNAKLSEDHVEVNRVMLGKSVIVERGSRRRKLTHTMCSHGRKLLSSPFQHSVHTIAAT
jgi:hypothetical protein